MRYSAQDAPHIRYRENTRRVMLDVLLALLFIYAMCYYYYGIRAVWLGLFSVAVCVAADILCVVFAGKRPNPRDLSPVVTGMLLPLMMPASIAFPVVAVSGVFAIAVAKHPFGGTGHNVFNPAAAGFAFAVISFPGQVFQYPLPMTKLAAISDVAPVLTNSPAYTLELGGIPKLELVDMLLGNFPGPMGATNILVIVACLLYLVFRNTVHWATPLAFFFTAGLFAFLFPRADMTGFFSVRFELMSGIILLGGVFLLGDPVTSPKRARIKAMYGCVTAVIAMLFRRYGLLEEEFAFAVLLMNATVWGFDMLGERMARATRRRRFEILSD